LAAAHRILRFSGLSREQMLASVELKGWERVTQGNAQGKGAIFITGHSATGSCRPWRTRLRMPPTGVVVRAPSTPEAQSLARRCAHVDREHGDSSAAAGLRRILRTLADTRRRRLIDQHINTADAWVVDFFDRPAADDVRRGGAGAAHRRAGDPVFAVPMKNGRYRMITSIQWSRRRRQPGRTGDFTQRCPTCSRCTCGAYPTSGCGAPALARRAASRGAPACSRPAPRSWKRMM